MATNGNGVNGNGANGFIDELGRTKLSKEEYFKKAKLIWDKMPRGSHKWPAIREALGIGYWPPRGGTEPVEWMIKANPKSKTGFQQSQINPGKGTKGRTGQMDTTRANRAVNAAPTPGREGEAKKWVKKHITDWNEGQNPWSTKLTSLDPEFRQWEHRIKVSDPFWKSADNDLPYKAGDVENFTWTNPKQVDLKNTGEMRFGKDYIFDVDEFTGDVIYTPRQGFNPHSSKFKTFTGHVDETVKAAKKIKPAVKGAKMVGKAIPYVGAAVSLASFADGANAAVRNPSAKNFQKLGLRALDVGLEAVDFFTVGLSTPLTLTAQAGLMTAEEFIDGNIGGLSKAAQVRRQTEGGYYDFTTM